MLIKQSYIASDKKVIFRWLCFPQVVQKLGEVEWSFDGKLSGIFVPKITNI